LNTFFKDTLLVLDTLIGSRSIASALKVAFTTLCGLADPKDFARTSVTPALSRTARMLPPAITPVPWAAGLIRHFSSTFFGQLIVRDRAFHNRNLDQVFLCIFDTLGNGFLNLFGFTEAMANHPVLITYNHECRETKSTSAFGCFYHTVDGNNFFFQFKVAGFYSASNYF
jgi:hypothetical protein